MEYYFADRKSNILGVGSTDGKGEWRIDNDIETQSVDNRPAVELSLDIHFTTDQEQAVNEMAKATNFIMYQDEEGNAHQMVIESVDHDSLGHIHSIVASDAGNDLINETVGAYKADKPYTIAEYILMFTNDSGWEIGVNEFPDNVRTLEWTEEATSLARIIAVAKDFDAVLSFGFEFVGTNLVKHVINIRHETAGDSLISFEMNKDINNIVTHLDTYDMETSIKAYGAVPESTDGSTNQDPINLIGYNWTDPTGQFVLDQYGFLHDTIAVQKYSRLLSNSNPNPTQSDWNRVKTFDSNSQAALLQAALADLKKYNHPNETYDIDLVNSPYVPLNQTVHIADENQQLFLSAKVLSIERCRAKHSVKLTLGEFAHETVSFDERLSELANQMANMPKTIQYYPWLRYADDDQGTNMSAFPTGKKYMAIVWSNKTSVPSDNPDDYAGKWALIQGKDGDDGVPGAKGADGRTSYFHTAWADDVSGQSGFTVSGGDGKKYIGTYSDFTQADSTNPSDYNWALFKGSDGATGPQGPQGPQGIQGTPGSKDVPFPYVQLDAPANPKKGDTWWHGTSLKDTTAVQRYDGSKWVDDAIAQAVLYIKELNSIILNSAEINSPNINVPFQHVSIAGSGILSSGSLTLNGASYVISGNIEDTNGKPNGQIYHTEVNPDGLLSYITQTDGTTQMHTSRISMGVLELTDLVSGLGNSAKYITSTFTANDAVDYYHKDSGMETNDVSGLNISYSRKGNSVTIGIAFQMKTGNGWVKIADIRPGYSPFNSDDAARLLGSMSYTGAACELYVSAGGIYIIPWRGQGGYAGSLNFITHDAYPTNDAVVN
ncbi:phage-related tail-host interaction protein [Lacticaseibacillus paracasei subsp. paracasei CNCM I-4270]|uniref:Phage-related tail-host interaction protein n=1 Tax=Lacticaseibacillus paracasei subsp. paracasei CNCM I-4270 TaxID=1256202 RepID=A0A8E0M8T1_LACPA|nr:phage-related tail-host interaction protein [Lacticaseibacillus paracasei subsp. paracasei CNCM I-4270]